MKEVERRSTKDDLLPLPFYGTCPRTRRGEPDGKMQAGLSLVKTTKDP